MCISASRGRRADVKVCFIKTKIIFLIDNRRLSINYSYLMASIGSKSAAFLARYHPKEDARNGTYCEGKEYTPGWMKIGQCATLLTIQLAPQPIMTPMIPPVILIMIASIKVAQNINATCADRHTQTDFTVRFGDGYIHDIHDTDTADQ